MGAVEMRRQRRLRMLSRTDRHVPISFALVGAQKAATSTLYQMLVEHPEIAGGPEKEMRFFTMEHLDWDHPDYAEYARPGTKPEAHLAGDATPDYTIWPHALERMRRYDPDMRILFTVRDPIERAMSQWSMQRARHEDFPDVPDAIDAFITDRLPESLPAGMPAWEYRRQTLFVRGLYAQQVRRGYDVFPAGQWLVLDFDDVGAQPHCTLDRVTDFLGVDRFAEHPDLRHKNRTASDHRGAAPTPADIARLVDLYTAELAEFSALTGLDVSRWSTSRVVAGELDVEDFTAAICRRLGLPA